MIKHKLVNYHTYNLYIFIFFTSRYRVTLLTQIHNLIIAVLYYYRSRRLVF